MSHVEHIIVDSGATNPPFKTNAPYAYHSNFIAAYKNASTRATSTMCFPADKSSISIPFTIFFRFLPSLARNNSKPVVLFLA